MSVEGQLSFQDGNYSALISRWEKLKMLVMR